VAGLPGLLNGVGFDATSLEAGNQRVHHARGERRIADDLRKPVGVPTVNSPDAIGIAIRFSTALVGKRRDGYRLALAIFVGVVSGAYVSAIHLSARNGS
jgi:hypothetical protein